MANEDPEDSGSEPMPGDVDFDELSVDDDLAEEVDELIEDRSVPAATGEPATVGEEPPPADVSTGADVDESIVPTQFYCRSCEYFSEPPEVHCNHKGTTIVEFVDLEHVRVRDCPIVARRRSLVEDPDDAMTPKSL